MVTYPSSTLQLAIMDVYLSFSAILSLILIFTSTCFIVLVNFPIKNQFARTLLQIICNTVLTTTENSLFWKFFMEPLIYFNWITDNSQATSRYRKIHFHVRSFFCQARFFIFCSFFLDDYQYFLKFLPYSKPHACFVFIK